MAMRFLNSSPLKATLFRKLRAAKLRLALRNGASRTRGQDTASQHRSLGIESRTLKGELVRSKAEKYIADFLFRQQIPYEYEPWLKLGTTTLRPDFYLPGEGAYVEFWGLITQPEYLERMRRRLALYHQFQINLVSIYQGDLEHMDKIFQTR